MPTHHNGLIPGSTPAVVPAPAQPWARAVEVIAGNLALRDYQEDAVREALHHVGDRGRVHQITLPTGAGKTRVAVALVGCLLKQGYDILWVAKRWQLLGQAADQLTELLPAYRNALRRIGGDDSCLRALSQGGAGRVYLTTLHTWHARRRTLPRRVRPSAKLAVVWDESHWAVNSQLGRTFRTRHRRAVVYGLTATPVASEGLHIVYCKAPAEMWGTVLAHPRVLEVPTGIDWSPEIQDDDFAPRSLRDLGQNPERNVRIIEELVRGRQEGDYVRTLIFACDIGHADALHRLIGEQGIAARVVHSLMDRREQDETIDLFRQGRVAVLVNVAMMIEGVDVPEIDSVFLARPTRSRTLLAQMIGRGARKCPNKSCFWVTEFCDNLQRLGDQVLHAGEVLAVDGPSLGERRHSYRPTPRHWESPDVPRFEEIYFSGVGTLPIAAGQTFGVEIELTAPEGYPNPDEWERGARLLIRRLCESAAAPVLAEPLEHQSSDPSVWQVMEDSSVGWEVVSPILLGTQGFLELKAVCDGLTDLVEEYSYRLHVNHRCGMHITLATRLTTGERLRGFVRRVQRLEPGLFTLTAPSRLYSFRHRRYCQREGNRYCRPLRRLGNVDGLWLADIADHQANRYHTVNLTRAQEDIQLLEVRMHHGTTEFRKIGLWTALWMQIFNRSRYSWNGRGKSGPVLPGRDRPLAPGEVDREDLIKLLATEGVPLTPEFVRLLQARRHELRESWRKVLPNRVASWESAGWYEPHP